MKLKHAISEDIADWGITLKTVEIQDINPSQTMQASMEEQAAAERWLNLDHVAAYLPHEPAPRSDRSFADFVASAGSRAPPLPAGGRHRLTPA